MTTTKEKAVSRTAGQLRLSEAQVRHVVDEYEKNRSAVNRETSSTKTSKTSKPKSKTSKPKSLGNGWYLMPDGSKAHGQKAAGLS